MDEQKPDQQNQPVTPAETPATPPDTGLYSPPPATFTPEPVSQPPKNKRIKLIIGIVVAVIVIVAGVLVYQFWYQNPEKVVTDGVMNTIKAKSVTYTGMVNVTGDTKVKVELQGAGASTAFTHTAKITFSLLDKEYTVEASALFDKNNDLYFKVKNIDTLVSSYRESLDPATQETIDKLMAKINDRWVKISATDLKEYSEEMAKAQTCISDTLKKYKDDDSALSEVAEIYKKNKFVTIDKDLGMKDGNLGYSLKYNEKVYDAFEVGLNDTKLYKTLIECDSKFKVEKNESKNEAESSSMKDQHVELWMNMWTHDITKLIAEGNAKEGDTKTSLVIQPKFNEKVDVPTPEKSVTLKQLQEDIKELMSSGPVNEEMMPAEEGGAFSEV